MATYLNRTPSSASNRKTWTYSTWLKRSQIGTGDNVFFGVGAGTVEFGAFFKSDNILEVYNYTSGVYNFRYQTNQVFRDPSAWYHIVIACDTTQGSAGDRVKIYVNNSQITSFSTSTDPSQNFDTQVNLNTPHKIGVAQYGGGFYLGYMAQTILVDGTALTPSSFGSTNANGIWVPNSQPSVTYGTNGFKLDFEGTGTAADASGFGADSSGNNNHFASNSLGTNPSTTDTCQNNFATFNSLDKRAGGVDFSLGNTKVVTSGSNRNYVTQTQAFASGKWYMECRFTAGASNGYVGFCDMSDLQMTGTSTLGDLPNEARVNSDGSYEKNNSSTAGWAGSFTDNDILGLALDCDNNRFTLSKNGQWADGSGNYDEANPTAYITYTAGNFMSFAFGEGAGGATATIEINTGNAPYTISSGNADGAGYGNFEYAVPSGYYALCTKNLAAYGG